MQLVAYGAQDIYLTGNPQITFFKVVYRRHTNFAVESIEQTFNGQVDFGKRVTATISRNGDLIQQMYLEAVLPNVTGGSNGCTWTYGVGNAMINKAEIEIGGQLIDRHYGDWMNIWTELTVPAGKRNGYDNMVGNALTASTEQTSSWDADAASPKYRIYVPFQFWFNRNPGLALPLIALQYHEVKLNLELRPVTDLVQGQTGTVSGSLVSCKLYVDYIYLDTDERRRFAQVSHEYLIEQVQFTGSQTIPRGTTTQNITLNFNHPVKELVWAHVSATTPLLTLPPLLMVETGLIIPVLIMLVLTPSPRVFSSSTATIASMSVMLITSARFRTTSTILAFPVLEVISMIPSLIPSRLLSASTSILTALLFLLKSISLPALATSPVSITPFSNSDMVLTPSLVPSMPLHLLTTP